MAHVAPYSGFLTRTADAERAQTQITVNGTPETLRPEAVRLRGVDRFSTNHIKLYVDYHLNYTDDDGVYTARRDQEAFRIQWIDDTSANVVFGSHAAARRALEALGMCAVPEPLYAGSDGAAGFAAEYAAELVQEREARPYEPTIAFHKHQQEAERAALPESERDLFETKRLQKEREREALDEDGLETLLFVRILFQLDRKVKNAAVYSRYYLLHGEPDRAAARAERAKSRGDFARDDDLFADKLLQAQEPEEDLFAWKMDSRRRPGQLPRGPRPRGPRGPRERGPRVRELSPSRR